MAKVSIRKDDLERLVQAAERSAKRSNEQVKVDHDRVDIQEPEEALGACQGPGAVVNFH